MEIEKKFQVKYLPEKMTDFAKKEIEQGYLCTAPVVRIRKSNEDYILTYKSNHPQEEKELKARMCEEVEVPLTREAYEHLREKIDYYLIAKTRYLVPISGGYTGELDVFHGRLEGLCFVEVEFPNEEAAKNFVPPEWFGENVSNDRRYTNSFLSCCDNLEVFQAE
ncbi:MAG: CYTH domain-containing protein [Lachnospiraceae bacterium]|jgi:CYTH domain-containing protein|nr:CYTH domain-containing protein [Lachnospiraceae bacterium]